MSRAWYKPNAIPKLIGTLEGKRCNVQVWNTTCCVTKAGKDTEMKCTTLINPANPQLSGVSKFPYFPKGGPVPKTPPTKDSHHIMGYVVRTLQVFRSRSIKLLVTHSPINIFLHFFFRWQTQWGGMEVGEGMFFAANVVDGIVHQLGGWQLERECQRLPVMDDKEEEQERCPVGQAVSTGPGGPKLAAHFDQVVHAVPPFYNHHPDPEHYLLEAYRNALLVSFENNQLTSRVACPLMGAGCRGFPINVAIRIAGEFSQGWLDQQSRNKESDNDGQSKTLTFAIPDIEIAEQLLVAMEGKSPQQ